MRKISKDDIVKMQALPNESVNKTILRSSIWMLALRWALRLIGIANTFVLARLLVPDDFGLVAMGMLMVGFVEIFGQTGQILALIRHPNPTREHYDTVWTVSILVGLAITLLLWALSPLAPSYFHDDRAVLVVQVLSFRALISGFENVGVVAFRKDLQFSKEFKYQVAQRVINLVVTLAVAMWLRNYWALVVGILGGRFLSVAMSFFVHPYRPRLSFAKTREIWSFSFWMLLVHVAQFIQDKTDEFVVGNLKDAHSLGGYNVAADLSTAPTVEMVLPTTRALFPIFSRMSDDLDALRRAFLDVQASVAIIVCATSVGVYLVAEDFVMVTLGAKWMEIIPLVKILAFSGGFYAFANGAITLISASGHGRLSASLAITRTVTAVPVLIAAALLGSMETIAWARTVLSLLFVPGVFFALSRVVPVGPMDILGRLWRPVIASAIMAGVVTLLHPAHPLIATMPVLRLGFDALVGAVSFAAAMVALWRLSGRPEGPEKAMVGKISGWLARKPVAAAVAESGTGPVVLVVSTFSSAEEGAPIRRGLYRFLRNRARRSIDRTMWMVFRRWTFDFSTYEDRRNTNRGDAAIRIASIQLLRRTLGADIRVREFGWNGIGPDFVRMANEEAALVVFAGGGYFFIDEHGDLPERIRRHAELVSGIRVPVVGLGLGVNVLLGKSPDHDNYWLSPDSEALLQRYLGHFAACSARDPGTAARLSAACADGSRVVLVPDPAVLMTPAGRGRHRPDDDGAVWVGVNLSFHGKVSARRLRQAFPHVAAALGKLKDDLPCRFLYFVHSDSERVLPALLRNAGIDVTVIDTSPTEMLDWYATLDIHLCMMLHSAIFAVNQCVPTINIAYDAKNFAFGEFVGALEVIAPEDVTAERLTLSLLRLWEGRAARRAALERRKEELARDMERFLDQVRSLPGVAAPAE